MTNKEIEEFLRKLYTQVQIIDRRLAQLEFAVTGGMTENTGKKSPAEVTVAAGRPGGAGGDFI